MKKKISLVVAVLVLVLGLAGCGNAKTVSYDKDTLIQSCDAVFDIIESGSITSDQITEMSDWNQGYLMAQFESQTGVQMEADTFATALEGWKASLEECGDYESHKDYEFEASSTGVTVTAPATFSDRSADLEFVFDENMTLESFTVNAHYGMSEILEKAGLNTLLGMGTVFVMLIFMSFIISLIKYVPALLNGTSKKKKEEAEIKNNANSLISSSERIVKDFEGKISEEDVKKLTEHREALQKALDENKSSDELKKLSEELQQTMFAISQKAYEAVQKEGGDAQSEANSQGAASEDKKDDDVIDAEFTKE